MSRHRRFRRSTIICLALFALLASFALAGRASAVELRWKFKAGEEYHYRLVQDTQMRMIAAGNTQKTTIAQTIDMTWKIVAVDTTGNAKLALTIDRIRLKGLTPQGTLEADSQENKLSPALEASVAPLFKALIGTKFSMNLTPAGRVTVVEGSEEKVDAAKNQAAVVPGTLSPDSISQMIKHSTVPLPAGPVETGQTWTEEREVTDAKLQMQYTYKGPLKVAGQTLDTIATKADIELDLPEMQGFKSKLVQGSLTGEAHFDSKRGRLAESNLKQEIVLSITGEGQSLRQEIQSLVTLKLVPPGEKEQPAPKPADEKSPSSE